VVRRHNSISALHGLRFHWPEYLMEAGELALYTFAVCVFATLLDHPASPVRQAIPGIFARRVIMGLAMGATVVGIVLSPWGKQSGAHFNPAVTFTFYRLGKVELWDSIFYATAQFFGAIAGVAVAAYVLRGAPGHSAVRYAVTSPGMYGSGLAFAAELGISFLMMSTILFVTNRETLARFTPFFAAGLIALFVTFESPLSGMSLNPARTFGSAIRADCWHAIWIYFLAPLLGMMAAAEVFLWSRGGVPPRCAKLHHANNKRCIFYCGYRAARIEDEHPPERG
jgi:aquaporin Z